jgi:hypothetical protein
MAVGAEEIGEDEGIAPLPATLLEPPRGRVA